MPPSRRRLLRTAGAVLTVGAAGCLSENSGGSTTARTDSTTTTKSDSKTGVTETTPDSTTDTTDTTSEPPTRNDPPSVREVDGVGRKVPQPMDLEAPDANPFLALAVGSCECGSDLDDTKPHGVWVWNDTDAALTVRLELTADGTTVLDDEYEFDPYANLALELRAPRNYELIVRAGNREETVEISRSRIDCNDSATDVAIRNDEIETQSITTDLACSTTTASDSA